MLFQQKVDNNNNNNNKEGSATLLYIFNQSYSIVYIEIYSDIFIQSSIYQLCGLS